MQIFPVSFNFENPKFNSGTPVRRESSAKIIPFGSNTSAGNPLKKLKKIKCPYFGSEMITAGEIDGIEKRLDKCKNLKEVVDILKKYKKCMLKTEKQIFKRFEDCSKTAPDMQLQDCLKLWYNEAITKLKLEEFNILDDMDKISLKLSPENALAVHSKTTRCRQVILENKKEDTFKRRILLDSLDEIHPAKREKKTFQQLKDRAVYLPTSVTSENAFIVKYANRSQEEIAKRLVRSAVGTIEHIKPNSKSGENNIANFILTSAGANNLRSNMPLYKFVNMFPNIPKNCQKYIDQIIELLHKGWLHGNETYPYKVRRTLAKESKGSILLDLSGYKYTEEEAAQRAKVNFLKEKYSKNSEV